MPRNKYTAKKIAEMVRYHKLRFLRLDPQLDPDKAILMAVGFVEERLEEEKKKAARADRFSKEKLFRALTVIHGDNPRTAGAFGKKFWRAHPGWNRKAGFGKGRGLGMFLSSGAYLGKLVKAGYVEVRPPLQLKGKQIATGWKVTQKGIEVLRAQQIVSD